MMYGHEKSDPAIVAGKPTNKAERSAAELVEQRAGTKGNADQQSTHRTQSRASVSQELERIRQVFTVTHPRWEPYAGKPHVRFCAGARGNSRPYRELAGSSRAGWPINSAQHSPDAGHRTPATAVLVTAGVLFFNTASASAITKATRPMVTSAHTKLSMNTA